MKKQLLLGSALLISITGFSQNGSKPKPSGIINMAEKVSTKFSIIEENNSVSKTNNSKNLSLNEGIKNSFDNSSNSSPILSSTFSYISSSMNIFGMLVSNSKPLGYNRYLQTVSFIQRKSPTYNASPIGDSNTGTILAYIGRNNGTNWDSTVVYANQTNQGRYPQGGIYNPPGNSNPDNAYVVATGPVTGGSGWLGNFYASKLIGPVGTNAAGPDQQFMPAVAPYNSTTSPLMTKNHFNRYSFSITNDGKVRSLGSLLENPDINTTLAQNNRGALLANGAFNAGVFVWTPDSMVPPCIMRTEGTKQLFSQYHMAWNDAGTVGYVVLIGARQGATNANKGWQPIVYKTTNSGNTWALVNGIDFNAPGWDYILNSMASVNTNSNLSVPFFNVGEGIDVTVDKNDKLHIFSTVVGTARTHQDSLEYTWNFTVGTDPGHSWLYQNTAWPYLIDFIGDGTNAWTYKIIDSVGTEGPSATSGQGGFNNNPWAQFTQPQSSDMRLQVSRTYDGEFVLYSWAESDTLFTTNSLKWNEFPSVMTRVQRICDGSVSTDKYAITSPPSGFNPRVRDKAYFHYMSPQSMGGASAATSATFAIPFTVSNNIPCDPNITVDNFYATSHVQFAFPSAACGSTVTTGVKNIAKNEMISKIFPNPATNNVSIQVTLGSANDITVELYNAIGQKVAASKGNGNLGENTINMNLGTLNAGVYFVKIKAGNAESTKKLVVE